MSKRTRHADNSKRQQPVQQQRAQAAQAALAQKKSNGSEQAPQQRPSGTDR
jgi:hypothetical protein